MPRQSKASAVATTRAQRVVEVMALKGRGWSFRDIALHLGITHQSVHEMYWTERRHLKAESVEASEDIDAKRDSQAERMEAIIKAWLPLATGTEKDEDGLAILNKDAAAIVLKADERLSKLYGLDAPTKTDVTSGGQPLAPVPVDLSRLTADELATLEALYNKAGVLALPGAVEVVQAG